MITVEDLENASLLKDAPQNAKYCSYDLADDTINPHAKFIPAMLREVAAAINATHNAPRILGVQYAPVKIHDTIDAHRTTWWFTADKS